MWLAINVLIITPSPGFLFMVNQIYKIQQLNRGINRGVEKMKGLKHDSQFGKLPNRRFINKEDFFS